MVHASIACGMSDSDSSTEYPIGQSFQGLLGFLWLIDSLFIFGPTRRCLHDLVAGTHVVKSE